MHSQSEFIEISSLIFICEIPILVEKTQFFISNCQFKLFKKGWFLRDILEICSICIFYSKKKLSYWAKSICILTKISRIWLISLYNSTNNFRMRHTWGIWWANKNFPTLFDLMWRYFPYHWSPRIFLKRWENFRNCFRPKLHVNQMENVSIGCHKKISAK